MANQNENPWADPGRGQPLVQGDNPYEQGPPGSVMSQVMRDTGMAKTALGGVKTAGNLINKFGGSAPSWMGTVGHIAAPIGIGLGGYNLIKGGTLGHNIASGASTGAGIGSMFLPGIGTGIGAGIGAGVGALRSLLAKIGGPSQGELQGRNLNDFMTNNLAAMATPEQKAAVLAHHEGWANPNDALDIVVMRDRLIKNGMDPQKADQQAQSWKKGMWDAEKGGAQNVYTAASPIMQMMTGKAPQSYQEFDPSGEWQQHVDRAPKTLW